MVFSFGSARTALSNVTLGTLAIEQASQGTSHMYAHPNVPVRHIVEPINITEPPGWNMSTLNMARMAIRWAKRNKFDQLVVVAAKPHLWRCVRDLRVAAREARADG